MGADPTGRGTGICVVTTLVLALAAVILSIQNDRPYLIYNGSGSAPIGFYRIEYRSPERGETVAVRPSAPLANLVSAYRLLPSGVPLLKQVAAVGGIGSAGRTGSFSSMTRPSPRPSTMTPQAAPCRPGRGVSPSSPASFSSSSRTPIRSTAGTLGRSARPKSSASPARSGPGIQPNRTRAGHFVPTSKQNIGRMSKQRSRWNCWRDKSFAASGRRSRCLHI